MFKRKCHKQGYAIIRSGDLLIMCECLEDSDIRTVMDWATEGIDIDV